MRLPHALAFVATFAAALFAGSAAHAHGACTETADCETGEICFEEECAEPCKANADCAEGYTCESATACVDPNEGSSGCATAPGTPGPAAPLAGLALVAAMVRLAQRRRVNAR